MSEQEQARWHRVLRRLEALFPEVTYEVWRQRERLLRIFWDVTTIADHGDGKNQESVKGLHKAADYLRMRSQYEQAEPLYHRALHILGIGPGTRAL